MLTKNQRISYFVDCLLRCWAQATCPSCCSKNVVVIDRKFLLSTLIECRDCGLYFRHPTDTLEANATFYQSAYVEGDGITTFTPSEKELKSLLNDGFAAFPDKSAKRILDLLANLFPGKTELKILDYGCSWGYISYQLRKKGFNLQGYEISEPRASYGRDSLELDILTTENSLRSENDVFLSSHVIEHVPDPSGMLAFAKTRTKKDGFIITICPNGSPEFRRKDPKGFSKMWGKVHPNYLNSNFFCKAAQRLPYYIATTAEGWQRVAAWDKESQYVDDDLSGDEILFICKM